MRVTSVATEVVGASGRTIPSSFPAAASQVAMMEAQVLCHQDRIQGFSIEVGKQLRHKQELSSGEWSNGA